MNCCNQDDGELCEYHYNENTTMSVLGRTTSLARWLLNTRSSMTFDARKKKVSEIYKVSSFEWQSMFRDCHRRQRESIHGLQDDYGGEVVVNQAKVDPLIADQYAADQKKMREALRKAPPGTTPHQMAITMLEARGLALPKTVESAFNGREATHE